MMGARRHREFRFMAVAGLACRPAETVLKLPAVTSEATGGSFERQFGGAVHELTFAARPLTSSLMSPPNHAMVIGAGAAGCFAAIEAARQGLPVKIYERGKQPLTKVRISGGGRCNVTHACFDPAELTKNYPRGHRELIGPFHHFQPRDTLDWFAREGVRTKTEEDGRIFPVTDSSSTIVDCLLGLLEQHDVEILYGRTVEEIYPRQDGTIEVVLSDGGGLFPPACLVAAGSLSHARLAKSLQALGHTIVEPVPSLFTFRIPGPALRQLAGVSVPQATVSIPGTPLSQSGPLLVTHWGLSGPAVLKLSAWAARELHACRYQCEIEVQWVPEDAKSLRRLFDQLRAGHPKKLVENQGPDNLPKRLWARLVELAGASGQTWGHLPAAQRDQLIGLLTRHRLTVDGKSTHKEEFVTCGGVCLKEINFRTMESKVVPRLFFAGECLDIDGVTGGFNFQAAWTTGFLAGQAMATCATT